jgi:hypothetical protein
MLSLAKEKVNWKVFSNTIVNRDIFVEGLHLTIQFVDVDLQQLHFINTIIISGLLMGR